MKNLIINADDFGMSREVNQGIQKGIEAGIINNVSLMVNLPYFDEAVQYLSRHPEVSVGLHFNITEGHPISLPVEVDSLLREDDYFYHWQGLVPHLILGNAKISQIRQELLAQYAKLKQTGLPISHIDSHHHIHLYPTLFKLVTSFADQERIRSLRSHHFSLWSLTLGIGKKPTFKQFFINSLLWFDSLFYNHQDLDEVDGLYDVNWEDKLSESQLLKILDHLPEGKTELICHLGILSESGNRKFLEPRQRKLELLTGARVKNRVLGNGINLLSRQNYRETPLEVEKKLSQTA